MRWFVAIILAQCLLLQACFLGRLPLGIETSFEDGFAKSWRFLRGPDASGTLEGAGGARGVLAVLKDASSWKAVAADTLGNVLALAGTNGDFTRRTFDPWGNPLVRDASGSLRAATLTKRRADYDALPLAWASQEYDPDTGLTHYHFREYSPSLGGWLTTDPIGLAGGYLNLRSYLGNRPADELDVWGEEAVITFTNGSAIRANNSAQFVEAVNEAQRGSISRITLYGHANPDEQTLDSRNRKTTETIRKFDPENDQSKPCRKPTSEHVIVSGDSLWVLKAKRYRSDAIVFEKGTKYPIGYDLAELLDGKLAVGAKIDVNGCEAADCGNATGKTSIAREISKSAPGAEVEGSIFITYRHIKISVINPLYVESFEDRVTMFRFGIRRFKNGEPKR